MAPSPPRLSRASTRNSPALRALLKLPLVRPTPGCPTSRVEDPALRCPCLSHDPTLRMSSGAWDPTPPPASRSQLRPPGMSLRGSSRTRQRVTTVCLLALSSLAACCMCQAKQRTTAASPCLTLCSLASLPACCLGLDLRAGHNLHQVVHGAKGRVLSPPGTALQKGPGSLKMQRRRGSSCARGRFNGLRRSSSNSRCHAPLVLAPQIRPSQPPYRPKGLPRHRPSLNSYCRASHSRQGSHRVLPDHKDSCSPNPPTRRHHSALLY